MLLLRTTDLDRPHDVRVLEPHAQVGFVEEHSPVLFLARVLGEQRLHGEQLLAPVVVVRPREVDDAHAPTRDFRHEPKPTDLVQARNGGERRR